MINVYDGDVDYPRGYFVGFNFGVTRLARSVSAEIVRASSGTIKVVALLESSRNLRDGNVMIRKQPKTRFPTLRDKATGDVIQNHFSNKSCAYDVRMKCFVLNPCSYPFLYSLVDVSPHDRRDCVKSEIDPAIQDPQ